MKDENSVLPSIGDEIRNALKNLSEKTADLAELNDEHHLHQEEIEGVIGAVIRVMFHLYQP